MRAASITPWSGDSAQTESARQAGLGPHAQEIMGDIPNYTNQAPVIQISEVVVG